MSLWQCAWGPRLYSRFFGGVYQANAVENVGDNVLIFLTGLRHFCATISPILLVVAYRRGWFTPSYLFLGAQYLLILYVFGFTVCAIGRFTNRDYREFVRLLNEVRDSSTVDVALSRRLKDYDYEMRLAPIDFRVPNRAPVHLFANEFENSFTDRFILYPLSYLAVHSFGRRMLYPGAVSLLKTLLANVIRENRRKLIVERGGIRSLLESATGDRIDTMFIDKRNESERGNILVITCEGNAAFYETGIMVTPLQLGYSVLGWNAPGFGESSGLPYPDQVLSAMDAVMQFARHRLGFQPEDTVIYAWSIGGFPATWAAAKYRELRGLILDATFDDLLPLALARMPVIARPLVDFTVRRHLDLNVARQLSLYPGPVKLIRRLRDEMIVTVDEGASEAVRRASNRANWLLETLILSRHPDLLNSDEQRRALHAWLAANSDERALNGLPTSAKQQLPKDFGQLTDSERLQWLHFLCSLYLFDFDSSHNTALDPVHFVLPVHP